MREIKFRGKRLDNNEWAFGYYAHHKDVLRHCETHGIYTDCAVSMPKSDGYLCPYYYLVNPETVGQFSGLQDKNGVDIYEGDILSSNIGPKPFGIVEWSNDGYLFVNTNIDGFQVAGISRCYAFPASVYLKMEWFTEKQGLINLEVEIIGNICDNPELLKGGEK